jgi:hypothetical protein
VHAFLALADELAAHGAPAELLARIAAAADDERRHAALVTDLALRHGASIITPIIAPTPTRDLLALAVENMAEGCVRETWAALSAAHQAKHAHTPELRDLYAGVAADETIHAELAWSIDAWLFEQLTAAEQTMLAAARSAAVRQLHASLAALPDEPELLALGVPDRPQRPAPAGRPRRRPVVASRLTPLHRAKMPSTCSISAVSGSQKPYSSETSRKPLRSRKRTISGSFFSPS